MANHEINEDQDALTRALRMIETGDPVHADVYNALFSVLINNDVFLEKLANKMIQQAMISHVTDCTNPDMVMGADQGPVFTQLIEKVKEQVDVLNTNQKLVNVQVIRVNNDTTIDPGAFKDFTVTFTEHSGIIPITALRGTGWWCGGVEVQKVTKNSLTIRFLSPLTNHSLKGGYADYVLFFLK